MFLSWLALRIAGINARSIYTFNCWTTVDHPVLDRVMAVGTANQSAMSLPLLLKSNWKSTGAIIELLVADHRDGYCTLDGADTNHPRE
jgi:hypothetical protein